MAAIAESSAPEASQLWFSTPLMEEGFLEKLITSWPAASKAVAMDSPIPWLAPTITYFPMI